MFRRKATERLTEHLRRLRGRVRGEVGDQPVSRLPAQQPHEGDGDDERGQQRQQSVVGESGRVVGEMVRPDAHGRTPQLGAGARREGSGGGSGGGGRTAST